MSEPNSAVTVGLRALLALAVLALGMWALLRSVEHDAGELRRFEVGTAVLLAQTRIGPEGGRSW